MKDYISQASSSYAGYCAAAARKPYNTHMCEAWRRGWVSYHLKLLEQCGSLVLVNKQVEPCLSVSLKT